MADELFSFRVDRKLKDEFLKSVRSKDLNASQVLRMAMRDFVESLKSREQVRDEEFASLAVSRAQMENHQASSDDDLEAGYERHRARFGGE